MSTLVIITTNQGIDFFVDEEDEAWVRQWTWYVLHTGMKRDRPYVVRQMHASDATPDRPYKPTLLYLHRELLRRHGVDVTPGHTIDHKDRNGLNNSFLINLRIVSNALNVHNSRRPNAVNLPRGVTRVGRKYQAQAGVNGKRTHLGTFNTPEEAAEAHRQHNLQRFGEAHSQ